MAIPLLNDSQKIKVGGGDVTQHAPIAVCGPGTGLGVANLVPILLLKNNLACLVQLLICYNSR